MADLAQNGAPVFVAPIHSTFNPEGYYTAPDSTNPAQAYAISFTQQHKPPASRPTKFSKGEFLIGKICVIVLGSILIVSSVISQAGAAVAFRFYAGISDAGAGIWCGYTFMAAGVVAIVVAHRGTRKLMIATTAISGLSVAAAITLVAIAAAGIEADLDFYSCYRWCENYYHYKCHCYYDDWQSSAVAANGTMVCAALMALISSVWLLIACCIALRRRQTSFKVSSTPLHTVGQRKASQPNIYENIQPTSFQNGQLQLTHQQPSSIYPPMSSQVVQMPAPYIPLQTTTNSTIPNQQVLQVPIQIVLTATSPQSNFNDGIQNQQFQTLFVPVQNVQQHQQVISINQPPPNTNDLPELGHHESPKNADSDAEQRIRFYRKHVED